MNLKHVITSLTTAVIVLAVVSGLAWFTMGKRTVTHQSSSPVGMVNTPRIHATRVRIK